MKIFELTYKAESIGLKVIWQMGSWLPNVYDSANNVIDHFWLENPRNEGRKATLEEFETELNKYLALPKNLETWSIRTLDVWGNEKDGFEVNDSFNAGTIQLPIDFEDTQLFAALIEKRLLEDSCQVFNLLIEGDDNFISITDKTNDMPILNLYKEERKKTNV